MQKTLQFLTSKTVLIALGIIVVSVLVWVIVRVRSQEKDNRMEVVRAIPSDAVFVLRLNHPDGLGGRIDEDGTLFALFREDIHTKDFIGTLRWLTRELPQESPMITDFMRQAWWVSAHVFGTRLKYLFAAEVPSRLYSDDVRQLTSLFARNGLDAVEIEYEDERIVTFKRDGEEIFHAAVVRRVLVASSSRILVENAIRNTRVAAAIIDVPHFREALDAAGANVDINVYVQHNQLSKFLANYCRSSYNKNTSVLARLGNFTVLDATVKSSSIMLNGFLFNRDRKDSYLTVLQRQKAQVLTTPELMPRTVDGAYAFAISNPKQFISDCEEYRQNASSGNAAQYAKSVRNLQREIHIEPQQFFANLHPEEIALAHFPVAEAGKDEQWFIIVKSAKPQQAQKAMEERITFAARQAKKSEGKYQQKVMMANNSPVTLYSNPAQGAFGLLLGTLFTACADRYFWHYGDYIVFGSSPATLKEFAFAAMSKRTLAQSVNLGNYAHSESNAFIYLNPKHKAANYLNVFTAQAEGAIRSSALLASAEALGAQLQFVGGGEFYCNIFYTLQGNRTERSAHTLPLVFETKLDAPLLHRPFMLTNHRNGQHETLVQDTRNTIYLIDNQGALLWKRSMSEPVMGGVQQIDILKNHKLQMVFNTKSRIYVIDRLGKDVPPYPLTLPSAATAPMSVFDYDATRDYRFFVPCADGSIRAYEADGKPLKGFAPKAAFGGIVQQVMHVRRLGRDFIVVTDNRKIYLLDRKGAERIRTGDVFPAPNTQTLCEYDHQGEPTRIALTTPDGELLFISFDDGSIDRIKMTQPLKEYHYFTADRQNNYVFLNGRDLSVYSFALKHRFTESVKQPPREPPFCFALDAETQCYGVYSAEEGKAYLWNEDGRAITGFPMPASAPPLVARLLRGDNCQVIIGDPNGYVSCYDLNN